MKLTNDQAYLRNPKLKRAGVVVPLTSEQRDEYVKCFQNPEYFIENYVKIITLDHGLVNISLYPFQKEAVPQIIENNRIIIKAGRQIGKTTLTVGIILWYILFEEEKLVAILANKAKTAREILSRVQLAYEEIPLWMQQGIIGWNKGDIELENKCRVLADSTGSSAIRGFSINFLYLDEFAFVPNNIAEDFFTSTYPTITSGKTTKILISSTPNGMNHFYRMWTDAVEGRNGFVHIEANWRSVPGRDQAWADDQKRVLGEAKYYQEMECEFLGSVGTLISSAVLKNMTFVTPNTFEGLVGCCWYEKPKQGHRYIMVVDTSRGKGIDYSAFVVIDVTEMPYRVVCTYRDNEITPVAYPGIISKIATWYNQAYVLIEINDIGAQVSDGLFNDYEYENMLSTTTVKRRTQLTWQFGGTNGERGVRTTKSVKAQGCAAMKQLVETQKLVFQDFHIISELSTFINKRNSYEADDGAHDDLAMCLVLFGWMTNQEFFADLVSMDIKAKLYREQMKQIEQEVLPLPILEDGRDPNMFVEDGSVWEIVKH
jgi:hypothetical protein